MLKGVDEIRNNLRRKREVMMDAAEKGILKAAIMTESNIKRNWTQRDTTGKGFQSRHGSHGLLGSISHKVFRHPALIAGYIFAEKNYAPYVELRWQRRYAYMLPGMLEVRDKARQLIRDTIKGDLFK